MAGFRVPGPLGTADYPPIDDGTAMRWWAPLPGLVCPQIHRSERRQWFHFSRQGGFPAWTLTSSPEAVALLKSIETLRLKPCDDQTAGTITEWVQGATIGYGHLIRQAEWATYKDGITVSQAEDLFRADLAPFERVVGDAISIGLQQYQFDALVILAFNIGETGFSKSSVVSIINEGQTDLNTPALESAWKAWNKSQRKVSAGLNNRRAAEWRIFTTGLYARW